MEVEEEWRVLSVGKRLAAPVPVAGRPSDVSRRPVDLLSVGPRELLVVGRPLVGVRALQ